MRGRFITFEGGEGAGKSTQVTRLVRRLEAMGKRVVATREPGGSPRAEEIRTLILSGGAKPFGPFAEALLFHAARADHLAKVIRPALQQGIWVVCDRFADSTRAYQGAAGDIDDRTLTTLERVVVEDTRPDLTLILDVPPEIGLERAGLRRGDASTDRFESESLAYHTKLRDAFLAIAAAEPGRCVVIDASGDAEAVERRVWRVVRERLLTRVPAGAARA